MQSKLLSALWAATVVSACTIPDTPLPNTISEPFRVQVQNASAPAVHNKFMNLFQAGGGDQHLYIGPVGAPTFNLILSQGAIGREDGLRAVIGGEFSQVDDTTKMFMTRRNDPRALFEPTYACNPTTDELQIELRFLGWQNRPVGGWICVRPAFDGSHEFRYYPPGNTKSDPNRFCTKVTLVVVPTGEGEGPGTTLSTSTVTQTSTTSSRTVTSPTASTTAAPFADLTSKGFAFVGCAPEARNAGDGGGRTLPTAMTADDTMTNDKCTAFCQSKGLKFSGTEYRRECWCANSYAPTRQPGTTKASLAGCSMTCAGDGSQKCGGSSWMSLYRACDPGAPCENAVFT